MPFVRHPLRLCVPVAAATAALLVAGVSSALAHPAAGAGSATAHTRAAGGRSSLPLVARLQTYARPSDDGGSRGHGDSLDEADLADAYAFERSAPAQSVPAQALLAARRHVAQMPAAAHATVHQITNAPLNAEPAGYTDPYWSNIGAGFRVVSGRVTALAVDGKTYYAGTAEGGVWKSAHRGRGWQPIWDKEPTLSIGALLVTPDHALWVGTGEANTNADSYEGLGVYRSTDGGKSFRHVGGPMLTGSQTYQLTTDKHGHIFAATSHGLFRHSSRSARGKWTRVLHPDRNRVGSPYRTAFITSVVVRPHTGGKVVLAADGWRGGTSAGDLKHNGFYESTAGGAKGTFHKLTLSGAIDASDIGRTTFAYSSSGKRLYAVVESPSMLAANANSVLQGVFVSPTGDPAGPWKQIADWQKLVNSGSALTPQSQPGYQPGIQAWYNQFAVVVPHHPMHFYFGLEEVFQTNDGGKTFTTASPYWNYGLSCGSNCPPTTHPDQHAVAVTNNGHILIGNDGGVYSRSLGVTGYGHWADLNKGLKTLQYYDAAAGVGPKHTSFWGGLQDNGTSVLNSGAAQNLEPAGGDGTMVLADPSNPRKAVGSYTNMILYRTENGGHSFTTISPLCGYYTGSDCDPAARFVAPYGADVHNIRHWVAAGNKVWVTTKGWQTTCGGSSCDWTPVHSFGTDSAGGPNEGTAVAMSGPTIYAAWVDSNGNPGPNFRTGIDTNIGGTWHRLQSPQLPNRFISGLTVDPANPRHVYAIFNGYSRRWIPGGGIGTVFESFDGGRSWRNITGNLPDAPGDGLAIVHGTLVLGTDVGLFVAGESHDTHWKKVTGLPNTVVDNVRRMPGRNAAVVATHGRGIWTLSLG